MKNPEKDLVENLEKLGGTLVDKITSVLPNIFSGINNLVVSANDALSDKEKKKKG